MIVTLTNMTMSTTTRTDERLRRTRGAMTSVMMEASGICIMQTICHSAPPGQSKPRFRSAGTPLTFISPEPALPRRHPLGIEVGQ